MKSPKASKLSLFLLILGAAVFLMPFYIMIVGSFKNNYAFYEIPPDLSFFNVTLANYKYLLQQKIFVWFINSVLISGLSAGIVIFIDACAAYSFAKKKFDGKGVLFILLLCTMMIPKQVLIVPTFVVIKNLHLNNTLSGIILSSAAASFGVFLLKQFMQTLPDELIEAGRIDGCSEPYIFFRIIMPLSKPAIGALAIFTFVNNWNDYMWQLIIISVREKWTLPLAIANMANEKMEYVGYKMAGAMVAALPMLVIFLSFQRYFVKGITMGSVKG
jgi:multiple sugar transport system permease protein